jgi:choline dehydrogenase-like flavoprotein
VHARVREDLRHPLSRLPGQVGAGAAYLAGRRGPLASGPYELVALARSDAHAHRPDVQLFATALAPDLAAEVLRPARHAGLFLTGYQLRPTSTGSVHVTGPAPDDPSSITTGYLTTAVDRAVTGRVLDLIRGLLATEPLAGLVRGEEAPGPAVASPDEVVGYAARTGGGLYHAVGSCAMGPGERAVVDDALRVRGVEGLRVVDASVFPVMPSGNTGAPTMALARRAAGLIAGA